MNRTPSKSTGRVSIDPAERRHCNIPGTLECEPVRVCLSPRTRREAPGDGRAAGWGAVHQCGYSGAHLRCSRTRSARSCGGGLRMVLADRGHPRTPFAVSRMRTGGRERERRRDDNGELDRLPLDSCQGRRRRAIDSSRIAHALDGAFDAGSCGGRYRALAVIGWDNILGAVQFKVRTSY
jgi:hypothetical protein